MWGKLIRTLPSICLRKRFIKAGARGASKRLRGSRQVIVVRGSVENTVLTRLKGGSDSRVRTTSATPVDLMMPGARSVRDAEVKL